MPKRLAPSLQPIWDRDRSYIHDPQVTLRVRCMGCEDTELVHSTADANRWKGQHRRTHNRPVFYLVDIVNDPPSRIKERP